ncbi:VWA domain-containing protein [Actinoalloteichus sp. AHMU CJ021]|uniref:von Willebrand factor type A domain-containing protein n=1 Tax=Actinoalloteichus caeruleus DSM 43889 TaxID=1120930 RepID=A0ABT1JCT2_ACTCY|nr:VWA domain-containing protein [Actinoalloteichus caeruleus]AUS80604.1 VWA domain-containing protein [Actinoalloteichus sp. AHMU CJ021]MCP2329983.1 von Willebrand factor type A domain-containing protein [Actinoalloteichus caeruleus DSM 43889]
MVRQVSFTLEVDHNRFVSERASEAHLAITVTGHHPVREDGEPGEPPDGGTRASEEGTLSEVLLVDCSSSMRFPATTMPETRRAAVAAVDLLPEGARFAVVAGTTTARVVYPETGGLAVSSARTRREAATAIGGLTPDGGTAMGRWLRAANDLFADLPGPRHAILLTDGLNQGESLRELAAALEECRGRFVCDCRGVGTGWRVDELRSITTALLGTVDIVADPEDLAADFRSTVAAAVARVQPAVALRVWTPELTRPRFLRQVHPEVRSLEGVQVPGAPQDLDHPTGSWGAESRTYHLCVEIPPLRVGEEVLVARLTVVQEDGGPPLGAPVLVTVTGSADVDRVARVDPVLAHYTGQTDLAEAVRTGLDARRRGDTELATAMLQRAVALATESGHEETAELLAEVVEVVDERSGTIRLRARVAREAEMALDARSTRTLRLGRPR